MFHRFEQSYYDVLQGDHEPAITRVKVCQISLSSLGNLRASGVATLWTPVCSSALGRYVPSVWRFFLTTQNRNNSTPTKITSSPTTTIGTTIATTLMPELGVLLLLVVALLVVVLLVVVLLGIVVFSPWANAFLGNSSRKLAANSPTCRIISERSQSVPLPSTRRGWCSG